MTAQQKITKQRMNLLQLAEALGNLSEACRLGEYPEASSMITSGPFRRTDLNQISALGVMMTPGLIINGVLKSSGRIPLKSTLIQWIKLAAIDKTEQGL